MIKECKVLSYNKFLHILVFSYDGKQIQITSKINEDCKTVFVKYNSGKYEIVSKNEFDKFIKETKNTSVKSSKKELNTDKASE